MPAIAVRFWLLLQGSFWFIPTLMAATLSALAILTVNLDAGQKLATTAFAATLGVEGARSVLSTIAGGMMTVASIVISLTFVALTTMSSQLGPRILVFFMRDRPTQIVLGAFTGTFLFALIALSSTGGPDGHVPVVAVLGAIALSVVSFGVMAFYVHHAAESLQADILVSRLSRRLHDAIDELAEMRHKQATARAAAIPPSDEDAATFGSPAAGYVEFIDHDRLLKLARKAGGRIDLLTRPAEFVLQGTPFVRLSGGVVDEQRAVQECITISRTRTPLQQVHFELAAITEVAVRALSPGINDPYTAATCTDRLFEGLAKTARDGISGDLVHEEDGAVLLTEKRHSFADYLDTAFAPIRQHARDDALVAGRMAAGYEMLAAVVENAEERQMLCSAAAGFRDELDQHMQSQRDREALVGRIDQMIEALERPASPLPILASD